LNWADLEATCSDSACDTANGGCTITLSDDFVMGSYSGEIDFSGKTITICAQGKVLDASGYWYSGLYFNGNGAGSLLELHDVVLQNGQSGSCYGGSNAGSACSSDANCPGSVCYGNTGGGAIGAGDGAYVEIHDSSFRSNTAPSGGAISAVNGANVEIHTSSFISNEAYQNYNYDWNYGGGAIYAGDGCNVEIYTSTFESNIAKFGGGAIYASNANVEIHNTTFQSNTATGTYNRNYGGEGGAINAQDDANVEIYDSMFHSSRVVVVEDSNTPGDEKGGAILAENSNVKIHESTFHRNTATKHVSSSKTVSRN
jgi:predicted outer membrane repeat protein